MIEFFSEEVDFVLTHAKRVEEWVVATILAEGKMMGDITFIYCQDDYLLKVNQEHLKHDFYTDIITFDYTENDLISGDLFISIDRVKENAEELRIPFEHELHRVMIHGVLHLLGYKDKTKKDKTEMTAKEDFYLALKQA
jgi:probable rRNA maturation factor